MIVREFSIRDCELWFVRLDVCIPLDLIAVGNRTGKVITFKLYTYVARSRRNVSILYLMMMLTERVV